VRGEIQLDGIADSIDLVTKGTVVSVRFDDGGHLPFSIKFDATDSMLMYQARNEPDSHGRIDALRELASRARLHPELHDRVEAILSDRKANDTARLVRHVAETLLGP
jgi:hypothetical protein